MFDCPKCGGIKTLAYTISLDVYTCVSCRLSVEEIDEDTVDDYLFHDDHYELVSSHIISKDDVAAVDIDVERLEYLRKEYSHRIASSNDGTTNKNVKRITGKPKHGEEHERSA